MVLVRSTSLYHVHFSWVCAGLTGLPAALYARLRRFWFAYMRNGSVGIWFCCVSTILYHVHFSRAARGNRLAGGSLLTVTTILVHIQAERESGDYDLVCFNIFIQCTFLPGCAGDTRLPTNLYSRLRRFWFAAGRESRDFILLCFNIFIP